MSGKRIYVAGHTGMLGSAIVRALTARGYDDLWLPQHLVEFSLKNFDLKDGYSVDSHFNEHRPDYVFMAAGAVGGIQANIDNPARFLADNARMAMNVVDACKEYGAKLCYVGSSCVYPRECPQPMREEYLWTGALEPTNKGYAIGKLVGVEYAQAVLGANALIPLPCNLYGTNDHYGENGHVLASLVRRFVDAKDNGLPSVTLWGNGTAKREFLFVDDCADALVFLMERDASGIVNVGSGTDVSINALAHLIADSVGYEGDIDWDFSKPNGMMRKCLDTTRLTAMGWHPSVSLETGIQRTVAEYRAAKECA